MTGKEEALWGSDLMILALTIGTITIMAILYLITEIF